MCSRDSLFSICTIVDDKIQLKYQIDVKKPLTAVAYSPQIINGKYIFSIGYENGNIELWNNDNEKCEKIIEFNENDCCIDKINKMIWNKKGDELLLCSNDNSIRLYNILL